MAIQCETPTAKVETIISSTEMLASVWRMACRGLGSPTSPGGHPPRSAVTPPGAAIGRVTGRRVPPARLAGVPSGRRRSPALTGAWLAPARRTCLGRQQPARTAGRRAAGCRASCSPRPDTFEPCPWSQHLQVCCSDYRKPVASLSQSELLSSVDGPTDSLVHLRALVPENRAVRLRGGHKPKPPLDRFATRQGDNSQPLPGDRGQMRVRTRCLTEYPPSRQQGPG
jgi:hypothetical protein